MIGSQLSVRAQRRAREAEDRSHEMERIHSLGRALLAHDTLSATGEADNRARALAAGWREDALGRIACPACLQSSPEFRAMYPLVPWDSKRAVAMLILWEAATPHHHNTTSDAASTGTG